MNQTIIEDLCVNKTCYESLFNITSRIADLGNVFILPFINTYGIITNTLCIIVFSSKRLKSDIYLFMLLTSISDLIMAISWSLSFIIRCGAYCNFGYNYGAKQYEQIIYYYLGNTCLSFSIFNDLYLAFTKMFSLSNNTSKRTFLIQHRYKIISILITLSILINIPVYLISRKVTFIGYLIVRNDSNNNKINDSVIYLKSLYSVKNNFFANDVRGRIFLLILIIIRGLFLLIILATINLIVLYRFKIYIIKKIELLKEQKYASNDAFISLF
jgi:hypothetical protein